MFDTLKEIELSFDWHVAAATLAHLPECLRDAQAVFNETGGIHAAGLFRVDGGVELAVELAREVGITLIGFTRDGSFNIDSHPARVS